MRSTPNWCLSWPRRPRHHRKQLGRTDKQWETVMSTNQTIDRVARPVQSAIGISRRRFLRAAATAGGGLTLSLRLPFAGGETAAADADGFAPNAFIRIGTDGQVVLTMPYVEMGQGTYTSIPMLIAEELEVDLKQVQ